MKLLVLPPAEVSLGADRCIKTRRDEMKHTAANRILSFFVAPVLYRVFHDFRA